MSQTQLKWGDRPSPMQLAAGAACRKRLPGCFCLVGWPPEHQCKACRQESRRESPCVCDQKEENPRP